MPCCVAASAFGDQYGAHVEQLREEGQLQGLLEETHARAATGAAPETDDAFDRLHVPEPPQLEALFYIQQLLAQGVGLPVRVDVFVDGLENRNQPVVARMRNGPVALHAISRDRMAATMQVAQEFVVH